MLEVLNGKIYAVVHEVAYGGEVQSMWNTRERAEEEIKRLKTTYPDLFGGNFIVDEYTLNVHDAYENTMYLRV